MCHIPVFCWITATVLEDALKTREGGQLPKSLTEMYIHFLVVQAKVKKVKYDGGAETDPQSSPESRKMMESLGKLAFDQLQKGNLIFYESDLTECGIDIRAASVYSGVFTQIFKEVRRLYQVENKVFCFIHLSVQEFLAALHVHLTFKNSVISLLEEQQTTSDESETEEYAETDLYMTAVDKALQSPNGHLDLFLRFLLGLSLQTNQTLLEGLLTETGSSSQTNQETVKYIEKKLMEILRRCHQQLYLLRKLNSFGVSIPIMMTFNYAFLESSMTFSITCRFHSLSLQNRNRLQRTASVCSKIIGLPVKTLAQVFSQQALRQAAKIINDPSHILHPAFQWLPSGRRFRCISCRTERRRAAFVPKATLLFNSS
ncbi:protein NLRC3-like [Pelmatolapia mariae]|uniref:protein NLRC3-like n=1 Tax=Pelmatolapia mariae TaxID=158779 RepID=UPI003211DD23